MKKTTPYVIAMAFLAISVFQACKKELSCEGCRNQNQPPTAVAGPDMVITLPTDSVLLDGSKSSDPDGTISAWQWTKVAGPAFFTIRNSVAEQTTVKNLTAGIYQFELQVTDDDGLSSKDTVQVIVDNPLVNQPPVANAGADQTVVLPTNTAVLDGSKSADPDNNITTYLWTKIAGPLSFIIVNNSTVQTQVTNLVEGVYQFELTVTDATLLSSKDTVKISVADLRGRPVINTTLTEIGTLSEPRIPAIGTAGSKIVFAGGPRDLVCLWEKEWGSSAVDIYDINTTTWSTASLSQSRSHISVANTATKIFFAGGVSWTDVRLGPWVQYNVSYDNVDIYDVTTNTWSVAHLSKAREAISTATVGNKIIFAGGAYFIGDPLSNRIWDVSDAVDICDLSTNTWSTAKLSVPRSGISSVVIGDKVYFAGGLSYLGSQDLDVVDVYNSSTNTWSTSSLPADIALKRSQQISNYVIWPRQNPVAVKNMSSGNTVREYISGNYSSVVGLKNNSLAFFTGAAMVPFSFALTQFDVYNTITNIWFLGKLQQRDGTAYSSKIAVNNKIYLAGGVSEQQNGCFILHDKVYLLDW